MIIRIKINIHKVIRAFVAKKRMETILESRRFGINHSIFKSSKPTIMLQYTFLTHPQPLSRGEFCEVY